MLGEIWVNVASGLAGGFIVWLLQRCWNLGKLLPLALKCNNRNKRIRVSVSYLIRVKVGEKFLLVKGEKINQWQPVGGVYKTFKDTESALSDLSVKYDDESTPHRPGCERDLRINLPRRNIIKFIRWFESGKEREVGPWREFYEELIETNILPQKEFHFIFARFIIPHKFREALTEANNDSGGLAVPAIKIVKNIISELPEQKRIKGHHLEAIASDAFRGYSGRKDRMSAAKHLISACVKSVQIPIADITGQSAYVDEYLGGAGSVKRRNIADAFTRIQRRMNAADSSASVQAWKELFNE